MRAVIDRCAAAEPGRFRAVRARFVGPVAPGETLRTRMWAEGARVVFLTEVLGRAEPARPAAAPRLVVANAYVDLTEPAAVAACQSSGGRTCTCGASSASGPASRL